MSAFKFFIRQRVPFIRSSPPEISTTRSGESTSFNGSTPGEARIAAGGKFVESCTGTKEYSLIPTSAAHDIITRFRRETLFDDSEPDILDRDQSVEQAATIVQEGNEGPLPRVLAPIGFERSLIFSGRAHSNSFETHPGNLDNAQTHSSAGIIPRNEIASQMLPHRSLSLGVQLHDSHVSRSTNDGVVEERINGATYKRPDNIPEQEPQGNIFLPQDLTRMAQNNDLKPDEVAFLVENGCENDIPDLGLTSIQPTIHPIVQRPALIIQPDIGPTDQVSIGQEIIPFMPTAPPSISVEFAEQNHRSEGESDVPDHLNCAVFITGFPTTIPKDQLYFELFKVIGSTGSIVSSIIYDQGANHRSPAARVTFRHPLPAAQLRDMARETGIWMYSSKLSVRYNRYGHREQNRRLHYQSRVVVVTVVNYPSWDLAYWMDFIDRICYAHLESSGYLPQSRADRLVMEFRFARIRNEAQKLVLGIKNSREFEGKVCVRYYPDAPCHPLHHRQRAGS